MNRGFILIIFSLLLLSRSIFANDETVLAEMDEKVKAHSCGQSFDYENLFELSISGQYTGSETIQWLSEINESILMRCPKDFIKALKKQPARNKDSVLKYVGITNPPWDITKALRPYINDPEIEDFINKELNGFFEIEEP